MDWSKMNEHILDLIISNLLGEDQHTFSLVCPSWHKALLASPHRYSPCLMYNDMNDNLSRFFQRDTYFSKHFPEYHLSRLQNSVIRFSNHGWLLMTSRNDDNTIFFYDPFKDCACPLPSIPKKYKSYTTICFFHPPTSRECFIVGIGALSFERGGRRYDAVDIGVLRSGEREWREMLYITKLFEVSRAPPVFSSGVVYFVDVRGNVATLDIDLHGNYGAWRVYNNRCMWQRRLRRHNQIKEHFLVKPRDEDTIYAVFGMMREERDVRVFRLVESTDMCSEAVDSSNGYTISDRCMVRLAEWKHMHWEAVDSLGDKVFYVSNTSANGYTTSDKSMANKIFFPMLHGDDKFVYYSLDTDKYHSVEGSYSSQDSHGLRRLNFATWTMPSQKTY